MDVVRWFVLVENGNVNVQFGCNGIYEGWVGCRLSVSITVSEDDFGVGASVGVAGQRGSYVSVFGSEALWVQQVCRVSQQRALQHGCNVALRWL